MTIPLQLPQQRAALVPWLTTAPTHLQASPLEMPTITGIGAAVPEKISQDDLWQFFSEHFGAHPLAKKVWNSCKISSRHLAFDPRREPIPEWTTGQRMQRYLREALPLGHRAVSRALEAAELHPQDVGLFAVVSCTGYATPGLDILLSRDLGMAPDVRRLVIGHMGCYAAVPGLGAVSDYVAA